MSTDTLSNATLRAMVERARNWHFPEPADRLWVVADTNEDFICLAKHSIKHREPSLRRLLELNPTPGSGPHEVWRELWGLVSNHEIAHLIGRSIMDSSHTAARFQYAGVAENVEELRQEAVDALVAAGPSFIECLNAVWQWANPSMRDQVWADWCQRWLGQEQRYESRRRLLEVITRGYDDLPERAWTEYDRLPAPRSGEISCWDDLLPFLRNPVFRDRALDYLTKFPDRKHEIYQKIMFGYPEHAERAMTDYLSFHKPPNGLLEILGWKLEQGEFPCQLEAVKTLAARRLLASTMSEEVLAELMRLHTPSAKEALRRLLAGEFAQE